MQVTADDVRAAHAGGARVRGARRRPRTRARSAPGPGCRASASRAASAPRRGSPPTGHTVAVLLMTNFGDARAADRGRRPGRAAAATGATPSRPNARRLVHRRRRDRRAGRRAGCARLARRVGLGPGAHRLGRAPRQRRDLPGCGTDLRAATATERLDGDRRWCRPRRSTTLFAGGGGRRRGGGAQLDAQARRRRSAATATPARGCDSRRRARPAGRRRTGVTGTSEREVRIPMPRTGSSSPATLYLPDPAPGPQPCLLEALPYRKDDLTSSYAASYARLRDEYGYAVCRLDLRGTGSSSGDATDEYPPVERPTWSTVIAWLADQEWCDGNVGMFGTSYSGFNSLQIACERPPALKAICAIYASDDRWTDDVHWRGGALRLRRPRRLLPLHDADVRAAARAGGAGATAGARSGCGGWRPGAVGAHLAAGEPRRRYWRDGSVRLTADGAGYDRIACPVMIVAGWADGYRNNSFRTVAALRRGGCPAPAARRSLGTRRPGYRHPGAADRPRPGRWRSGSSSGSGRRRAGPPTRTGSTCSCVPRPGPRSTSSSTRAGG